jgi:hypothetical protein
LAAASAAPPRDPATLPSLPAPRAQIVYTHAKAKAIEFMVTDALVAADRHFRFDELIWQPRTFKTLDDTLLKRIEWSTDADLAEARGIIRRLRCAARACAGQQARSLLRPAAPQRA